MAAVAKDCEMRCNRLQCDTSEAANPLPLVMKK